ncbi:MAG: AAA family ATPase, partial [Tannerellaceae bacterium]
MKILAIRGCNIASLEGKFEVDFTVEPLVSAGIFAITGATGAGKSSLLDTMCLALYGTTPRLQSARGNVSIVDVIENSRGESKLNVLQQGDARNLLRRGTSSGYAEVDFLSVDGNVYRS